MLNKLVQMRQFCSNCLGNHSKVSLMSLYSLWNISKHSVMGYAHPGGFLKFHIRSC